MGPGSASAGAGSERLRAAKPKPGKRSGFRSLTSTGAASSASGSGEKGNSGASGGSANAVDAGTNSAWAGESACDGSDVTGSCGLLSASGERRWKRRRSAAVTSDRPTILPNAGRLSGGGGGGGEGSSSDGAGEPDGGAASGAPSCCGFERGGPRSDARGISSRMRRATSDSTLRIASSSAKRSRVISVSLRGGVTPRS